MPKLFSKHLSGVSVPHHKDTAKMATVTMPIPDTVRIVMIQHMGAECTPLVKAKDPVKVGQKIGESTAFLSAPIHSSVSGQVKAIEDFITPAGARTKAVVIETDKLQEVDESIAPPVIHSFEDFIQAIKESGLVGLGGAGFPTHIKLNPKNRDQVDTLVINAAECEPYITSDVRAILEEGEHLIAGMATVMEQLGLSHGIIGIEDNKPEAIAYLESIKKDNMTIKVLQSKYPQGGEKVLIYETTGRIVAEGMLPADVGVIVMNVSSVIFLDKYLHTGMPLISKRLTVAGGAVAQPQNVLVPIGTAFGEVIEFCGGYKAEPQEILMGGPMMGIAVYDDNFPVLKNNNAILALTAAELKPTRESACIRCGKCMAACPFDLMPAAIERALKAENAEELKNLKVHLCMECGCCSYVCPAKRDLVLSNRLAKKFLRDQGK